MTEVKYEINTQRQKELLEGCNNIGVVFIIISLLFLSITFILCIVLDTYLQYRYGGDSYYRPSISLIIFFVFFIMVIGGFIMYTVYNGILAFKFLVKYKKQIINEPFKFREIFIQNGKFSQNLENIIIDTNLLNILPDTLNITGEVFTKKSSLFNLFSVVFQNAFRFISSWVIKKFIKPYLFKYIVSPMLVIEIEYERNYTKVTGKSLYPDETEQERSFRQQRIEQEKAFLLVNYDIDLDIEKQLFEKQQEHMREIKEKQPIKLKLNTKQTTQNNYMNDILDDFNSGIL